MDFNNPENLRGGAEYVDTVRALHQTVVSLRSALEKSRSEVLQLRTQAWPVEDLESALTALTLENHLLRKKILDLNKNTQEVECIDFNKNKKDDGLACRYKKIVDFNKNEQNNAGDGLACRFKLVASSLENLTTKSQGKSSQFSQVSLPARTKSFHSLFDVEDNEPIFTSTPLRSNKLNINNRETSLTQHLGKPAFQIHESGLGILKDTTIKEPTEKTTCKKQDNEQFQTLKQPRDKIKTEKVYFDNAYTQVNDQEKTSDYFLVNKHEQKFLDNYLKDTEGITSTYIREQKSPDIHLKNTEGKESYYYQENINEQKSPQEFQEIKHTRNNQTILAIEAFEKEESPRKYTSTPEQKSVVRFENQAKSIESLDSLEESKQIISKSVIARELSDTKDAHLSAEINQPQSHTVNKQALSKDKRSDKKISVSVNLEIYRKPSKRTIHFEMEPEEKNENVNENILRHSSSTDLLDQEVDDIELIFTNEDTKETNLKEPLISIEAGKTTDFDQNVSAEGELEDDVFNDNFENENQENINFQSQTFDFTRENSQIYNSKSDNSINHDEPKSLKSYYSYQDSSFENKSLEKDESFDRFDERVRIVETDISKVGIQDVEYSMGRRNTCPNPIQYRPIAHREAISRGFNTRKTRPILAHSNASRKESGAQTDISALPNRSSWRSESSLAHKVKIGDNFTTLPSKYPLPGSRLRLSEKTVEARRILLSDIGFTSMVPELSRSADHLFPPNLKTPSVTNYGQFLKTTDLYSPAYTSQRFMWTTASPSDSHSQSRYSSLYPLPSPSAPSRRCSAPVSPCRRNVIKHVPSKVRFANGSLPELRGEWNTTIDSGDSTDSLVEEAEQYLRRSIDCIVSGKDISQHGLSKTSHRRASAPEPARDNIPPQGWQPFLPRLPRDLRLDYWVKVISPEGRVRGGRVRFIGELASYSEQYVGVQLSMPEGHSDGTYNNRRYFQCEPYHGIFVPFKKVIMGWKP